MHISSDSEIEVNLSDFISDKLNLSNVEIFNRLSDSGSETETEEPIVKYNTRKNCLPKITEIRSLWKNKVKLVKVLRTNN